MQPLNDGVGRDDDPPLPASPFNLGEDAAFGRKRLRRGDMGNDAIDTVLLTWDQLTAPDEFRDTAINMFGRDALQVAIECCLDDIRYRKRGFALSVDTDGGGDSVLSAQLDRREPWDW